MRVYILQATDDKGTIKGVYSNLQRARFIARIYRHFNNRPIAIISKEVK